MMRWAPLALAAVAGTAFAGPMLDPFDPLRLQRGLPGGDAGLGQSWVGVLVAARSARSVVWLAGVGTPAARLGVGDRIGGARIVGIDPTGIDVEGAEGHSRHPLSGARPGPRPRRCPACVTVRFRDAPVALVLDALADAAGLGLVGAAGGDAKITLALDNVDPEPAFAAAVAAAGLTARRIGAVVWVAPAEAVAKYDQQQLTATTQRADAQPLVSRVFRLHYPPAADVARMLAGGGVVGPGLVAPWLSFAPGGTVAAPVEPSPARMLSRRGAVTADARTNQLFVFDLPDRLEQIAAFVAQIDVPQRQVVIEVKIVEADSHFSRRLGVGPRPPDGGEPPWLAISLVDRVGTVRLNLQLAALEASGAGQIVSRPRIVTTDNRGAVIEQGTELPYQNATRSGATAVSFRRANLRLEVLPKITPGGLVMLGIDVSKDSVGRQTTQGYAIDTKHLQTQVTVDDGGTVVLGGIIEHAEQSDTKGLPGLARLPGIGWLFGERSGSRQQTELLVFVTPQIVAAAPASR